MKDIAKLAGVSYGTVSNVLNNRGNVSAEKIITVKKASEKLGYSLNDHARQLRSQHSLTNTAAIILPSIDESRYSAFYGILHKYFQDKDYRVMLYTTGESPYNECKAIEGILSSRAKIVVSISCFTHDINEYEPLRTLGSQVFFVERTPPGAEEYFGYDYRAAGFEMGRFAKGKGYKSLSLVIGLDYYSNESIFEKAFFDGFENGSEGRNVTVYSSSFIGSISTAFDIFSKKPLPDAVVCSNEDLYRSIKEASSIAATENSPAIYTLSHSARQLSKDLSHYVMNYSNLGLNCSEVIYKLVEKQEKKESCYQPLKPEGFKGTVNTPRYFAKKKTLNLLFPNLKSTSALMRMASEFTHKSNIDLNFVVLPIAELTENLALSQGSLYFDVIRTNVTTTPGFSKSVLMPMDKSFFDRMTCTMLENPVRYFSYIDGEPFAIPFDFNMYLQVYHRELFADAVLKKRYLEANGSMLSVPKTYEQFNTVAKFFTREYTKDSPVAFGTTATINENTTIVYDFFRRYLSFGGKIVDGEKQFAFNEEIAHEALENLIEMMKYSITATDISKKDVGILHLLEGTTAIEIITASQTSDLVDIRKNRYRGRIDFSSIPMSRLNFGGGALAVPAASKNKEEALSFIEWACGKNNANMFTRLGGLSPHKTAYTNNDIANIHPWYSAIYDMANNPMPHGEEDLNYVNRYKFEKTIGMTLRNVYHNVISPKEAAAILGSDVKGCLISR